MKTLSLFKNCAFMKNGKYVHFLGVNREIILGRFKKLSDDKYKWSRITNCGILPLWNKSSKCDQGVVDTIEEAKSKILEGWKEKPNLRNDVDVLIIVHPDSVEANNGTS